MSDAAFDTNILIDALKGVGPAQKELTRYKRRYISRLTWAEIMACALPEDGGRIERFLSFFTVTEISEEIARRAASLRAERMRLTLGDALTLASAQVAGRILVTRNTKDFPANMLGIRVPYTR
jgi:predicted nucleic acid-binding protein